MDSSLLGHTHRRKRVNNLSLRWIKSHPRTDLRSLIPCHKLSILRWRRQMVAPESTRPSPSRTSKVVAGRHPTSHPASNASSKRGVLVSGVGGQAGQAKERIIVRKAVASHSFLLRFSTGWTRPFPKRSSWPAITSMRTQCPPTSKRCQ